MKQNNNLSHQEQSALKKKVNGKNYVLSDFSFKVKPSVDKKNFKEFIVTYLYKDKTIEYYCFVRKEFNKDEALEAAKKQISNNIKNGKMISYAHTYYNLFY